jgi:hypothetical protein
MLTIRGRRFLAYTPPAVIDADAHVIKSNLTWDYLKPAEEKYRPKIAIDNSNPKIKKWDVNGEVRAFVVETVEAPDGIGTTAGKSDRNVGTPAETRQLRDIEGRLKHMDALDIDIQILHNSLWLYSLTTDPDAEAAMTFAWNK